ncbi:MAG: phage tail protein [Pseudomonadota bacterium]
MTEPPVFAFSRRDPSTIVDYALKRRRASGAARALALGGSSRDRMYFAQLLADEFGDSFVHMDLRAPANDVDEDKRRLERMLALARTTPTTLCIDGGEKIFEVERARTNERRQTLGPYLQRTLARPVASTVVGMVEGTRPRFESLPTMDMVVTFRAPSVEIARPIPLPRPSAAETLLPHHRFAVEIDGKPIGLCDVSAPALIGGPYVEGNFDPRGGPEAFAAATPEVQAAWPTVTLRRACGQSRTLFEWKQAQYNGKPALRDLDIHQLDWSGTSIINTWQLSDCWPKAWYGPTFDANNSGISFESLAVYYRNVFWQ